MVRHSDKMTTPSTMTTAFQTLLSSVSEMGLNEGDFLRMNNLLKKAYDGDKKEVNTEQTVTRALDIRILLKDTMDKRVFELKISHIIRRLDGRDPERYFDSLPTVSINGHFKSDIHTSVLTFKHVPELGKFLSGWIHRVRPMTITVDKGGFETNYTFKSVLASCKVEDAEEEFDDGDGEFLDYTYSMVMGHRFVEQLKQYILTIAY